MLIINGRAEAERPIAAQTVGRRWGKVTAAKVVNPEEPKEKEKAIRPPTEKAVASEPERAVKPPAETRKRTYKPRKKKEKDEPDAGDSTGR